MLRSKYAKPETPTYAEYIFEYKDAVYTVKRSPDYERPKTRGTGMTTQKGRRCLLSDGRAPVTKLKEVNQAVTELIGLDMKQFTQIAMIAQEISENYCWLIQRNAAIFSESFSIRIFIR